jgi:CIC family chloride channel protein
MSGAGGSALRRFQRLPENTRTLIITCFVGLAAGLSAVAFHYATHSLYTWIYESGAAFEPAAFALWTGAAILVTTAVSGLLMAAFAKDAAGSGIPQLKAAFWQNFGNVPLVSVIVKFVAGVLTIGGGTSLGREGPSVYIAGGLGGHLAGWFGVARQKRRFAVAAGAAAGLAAAFNTPLAAITFVLEEIVDDFNFRFLGSVLLASVLGAFTAHALIGSQPAFVLPEIQQASWLAYVLAPLAAAAATLVGVLFQKTSLTLRSRCRASTRYADWMKPLLGAAVTWALGMAVYFTCGRLGVFGLGYADLSEGLAWGLPLGTAALLLAGKLLATTFAYGSGGSGGIFAPCLFLGGMCGVLFGGLADAWIGLSHDDKMLLAVVGMSACLGGVVRAPITSILIVFEMTHDFAMVPALILGCLVSQPIARSFTRGNFYGEILDQDGIHLEHVKPPRDLRSWQGLPVSSIANFKPVFATSLDLPALGRLAGKYSYQHFPVLADGRLQGILPRSELLEACRENRPPVLSPVPACRPHETIREIQMRLIDSTSGVIVVQDYQGEACIGLLTLHDLLRAETRLAGESG